jgi:hypothetical protein
MITFTQLASAALDEAAAIVEAEWMRLQRQDAARADDLFAEPVESSAPRRCPPAVAIGVSCVRRPWPIPVTGTCPGLVPADARRQVWATERSPPRRARQQ